MFGSFKSLAYILSTNFMQLFLDSILVGQSFGATLTETTVCKNGDKTEKFSRIAMYINVLPLIRKRGAYPHARVL